MLVLAEVYHHRTEGDTDYDSDVPLDALPPPGTQSIFVYSLHPLQPSYGAESPCPPLHVRPPSGDRRLATACAAEGFVCPVLSWRGPANP